MNSKIQNIQNHLKKPLVVIGLMGAGKSHVGAMLAKSLHMPLVDVDRMIEEEEGRTIAQLFETKGEPYFRTLERNTISSLIDDGTQKIISAGGGAVMNEDTANLIWSSCVSIWLKADLDVLVERTSRNNNRPLLKTGNPCEILSALMEKRYPVYGRANICVDSNSPDVGVTLEKTLTALEDYLKEEIK